ncbi:MAG TPA: RdgB/HAM1 family non-canonical purine NTP pyrophosphatase [Thermoprotei archaeon]|nr:RdgB/HAM1 family non-canonical purine NTP pyrophosphatase [Thermoprotei archaeon]
MKEFDKIHFVTSNRNKYEEASEIFGRYKLRLEWVNISVEEVQSDLLLDVILWKGYDILKILGNVPFIVEDTGLFINYLNGFPGTYSSYVYKSIGCKGILKLLEGVEDRTAYFLSYGLLHMKNNIFKLFKVRIDGIISFEERGMGGFGFDPIFIPEGHKITYAEMGPSVKNNFSHRGKLFNMIAKYILSRRLVM